MAARKINRAKNSKSPNANIQYLLKKKNLIYKWIVNGLTISDVAAKLGVSRSWLFEAFKSNAEIAAVRDEAYNDRREKLSCTLYQMALGNYKTRVRRTKTTKSETTIYKEDGTIDKTVTSDTVVEHSDDIIEHINDPNLKAMSMILRHEAENQAEEKQNIIEDTISDVEDLTYIDVENFDGFSE